MNSADRVETLSFVRTNNPETMQLEISCGHCGRTIVKIDSHEVMVHMEACRETVKHYAEEHMKESPRCIKMKWKDRG